jgi:hypothetical protein
MSFSQVTNESWFSRIGGSIAGVLVGLLLVVAAIPLLFWNEGRAVHRARTLAEGREMVVENVSNESVDPGNEKKLVHMSGTATSHETLADASLDVSVDKAIKLKRVVQMFQWKEDKQTKTKKKLGGGNRKTTTYSYDAGWYSKAIDSSKFDGPGRSKNTNPTMPLQGKTFDAKEVDFGAFQLNEDQIQQCDNYESLELPAGSEEKLAEKFEHRTVEIVNNQMLVRDANNGTSEPSIGDLRVSYKFVGPSDISFLYQQVGNSFAPFKLSEGSIAEFAHGKRSADEMFTSAETANSVLLWILRAVGFGVMAIGFGMVFRPFAVLADVVPFAGSLVGFGFALISGLLAASISLFVIAVAWIFYRPVLGICLLVAAIAVAVLVRMFMAKNSKVITVDKPVVLD